MGFLQFHMVSDNVELLPYRVGTVESGLKISKLLYSKVVLCTNHTLGYGFSASCKLQLFSIL